MATVVYTVTQNLAGEILPFNQVYMSLEAASAAVTEALIEDDFEVGDLEWDQEMPDLVVGKLKGDNEGYEFYIKTCELV